MRTAVTAVPDVTRYVIYLAVLCLMLPAGWAASEEAKTFDVSGTVLMPDGSPAPEASVEARDPWKEWSVAGKAATDASGRFRMSLPKGKYCLSAASGMLICYDTTKIVEVKADGSITGDPQLKLVKGCMVYGSVIDKSTGKFVSGAQVISREGDRSETGADGSFHLLLRKGNHTLSVMKDGYAYPVLHINTSNQDSMALIIETKPGGTIKGRITDDKGNPIAGAGVGASGYHFDFQRPRTGADGEYVLAGLDPDGHIEITTDADGYEMGFKQGFTFPAGQREATLDFQLIAAKYRDISGRVTRKDGTPITGAKVSYGWTDCYGGYKKTTTDQDGRYTLAKVNVGRNLVVAEAKGFAPGFEYVEADVTPQTDFILEPGHWVEGRFVDSQGKPVEGVHVGLDVETPEMAKMGFCGGSDNVYRWVDPRTDSDKNGHFRLENLPAGRILIETYKPGYVRIFQMPLKVDKADHLIVVDKPLKLAGTVVSAKDSKPIPEFRASREYDTTGTAFNTPDGSFELSDDSFRKGQKINVVAEATGYCRVTKQIEAKTEAEADPKATVFRLQPAVTFEGTVAEAGAGKPLDGVLISVADCAGRSVSKPESVRTDAQGRFRKESYPVRYGNVMLERAGYGSTVLKYVDLSKPLKASMAKGASVSGILLDKDGKPLPNGRLSMDSDVADYRCITTDAAGKFSVTDLAAGRYYLYVSNSESMYTTSYEFDLAAGQSYIVDWSRPGEAVMEGAVTLKGRPVSGVRVGAGRKGGGHLSAVCWSDKDGKYRLSFYKAGDYNVTWSVGDWMDSNKVWVKQSVTLKKGVNRVDKILPGASISGRMLDAAGKPVAKAKVRAYIRHTEKEEIGDTDWSWQHTNAWWWPKNEAETDSNGEFHLKNLVDGTWLVALNVSGTNQYAAHTAPFKLGRDEEKKGVVLKAGKTGSASVAAVDPKTGKAMSRWNVICVDDWGFLYYPDRDESCTTAGCSYEPKQGDKASMMFSNLPAGRYKAVVLTESSPAEFAPFEVKPGKRTALAPKLHPSGGIVFRLKETDGDMAPGVPWIGFKVMKPGSGRPVLADYNGPYWGSLLLESPGTPGTPGTAAGEGCRRSPVDAHGRTPRQA